MELFLAIGVMVSLLANHLIWMQEYKPDPDLEAFLIKCNYLRTQEQR